MNVFPQTILYGVTADFTLQATVPIIHRRIKFDSGERRTDTGIGDIPLLGKYRFFQHDERARTSRASIIGGAEIPTFDSAFSSESVDPIIGAVFTHQRLDWWIDVDALYKFNTGGGLDRHDELSANLAASYRLFGGEHETRGPWGIYAIGEVNTRYLTDGSHQVFLSPGVQYITSNVILEAGVQLPVSQSMKSPRLETDFTTVLSVRIQF